MPDQNTNQEPSLDDIFSPGRKQSKVQQSGSGQPFKFLDSYTRKDKNIFFGRDNETDELFRKFYSGKLLLVYGKSGTGKSSVINCGLISRIPDEDIFAINIRCGKRAYNNFVCEIKKSSKSAQENPIDILEDIFYEHSKPVTLILDQFEEIFILSDEEERKKLAEALNEILKSRLQINVILIIREEYFASLTEFEPHIPGLYGNRIRIERMNKSAAKEAIVKPCLACNVGIESGLADNLVEQLVWQSEALELTWLQILMDKLYRIALKSDPENPVIKHEDLGKLGRIGNVLGDFLDEQLRSMPNADLGEALLKTMVSTDGTKKQLSMKEISASLQAAGNSMDLKVLEDILRHLINVRIITDKDEQGYYELRHDAIAGRIYERMTAVEKEMIEIRAFLDNSYKLFLQRKVLLSENDLKYIELFESKLILNDKLKDFILASRKDVQKKRLRRRFITASAVTVIILVLSGFSLWAFIERTNAIKQTRLAEEQKNEAVRANSEAENAKIRAQDGENRAKKNETEAVEQQKIAEVQRQVAIKANREAENSRKQALEEKNRAVENEKLALTARQDAENAKNEVIKASSQTQFYLYLFNGKELANKSLLMQENDTLRALLALSGYDLISYGYEKFSANQLSAKYDGEILKALQNSLLLFQKDSVTNGEIWAVAFENNRIIFSNRIGQLSVAKLEDKSPGNLPVITLDTTINLQVNSLVRALSFDPLSNRLACGTIDGSVTLFENFDSDKQLQKIIYSHNNNRVLSLAFVPGKNWLISSSTDRTIRIWDLSQQKIIRELVLNGPVQKFIIVNSEQLFFINSSGQILLWRLNDVTKEPQIFYTDHQSFQNLAYNAEYKWLAAASSGTVMIFRMPDPDNPGNLNPEQFTLKHRTVITQLGFSRDNRWLITASTDALMLWDLRDIGTKDIDKFEPIVLENNHQLFSLCFDENSRYIFYTDSKIMHIRPIDIKDTYTRLKVKMGKKKLNEREWNYYVKGDLVKP